MRKIAMVTLAMMVALASPAVWAGKIFMNGVDISQVRGKTFKEIKSVLIDGNGDVHIDAPGYDVKIKDASSSASDTTGAILSKKYFLGTQPSKSAQYDIVVKVNGVERALAKAGDGQLIMEVNKWLKKGENTVQVIAKKNLAGGRLSTMSSDKMSVFLGEGHEEGSVVKIDSVKVSFSCNASQLTDITKTYVIHAK